MRLACLILLCSSLLPAQELKPTMITVKGHTLGESVEQFAEVLGYDMGECERIRRLSPKEAKKAKLYGKYDACTSLSMAMEGHSLAVWRDIIPGSYSNRWEPIEVIRFETDSSRPEPSSRWSAVVENGRLSEYTLTLNQHTYDEVVAELQAKYGPPASEGSRELQNGFGARFEEARSAWVFPDGSSINLSEAVKPPTRFSGYDKTCTVIYRTKQRLDELVAQQQEKPRALE